MTDSKGEKSKINLRFKPINKGLGFQPFSEGLPYSQPATVKNKAPETPKIVTPPPISLPATGSGATQAGPPKFVIPPASPDRPTAKTPPVVEVARKEFQIVEKEGFGYLFKRFVAYLIDTVLNSGLCLIAFYFALGNFSANPAQFLSSELGLFLGGFLLIFNWAVISAQEIVFQTSIGKRFFNITLQGNPFIILLRSTLFLVSILVFGLGIIWTIFDSKKRGWHDIITQVQPREIAEL